MNAQEAKEISNKNLKGMVIKPYLEIIYTKVKEAALKGKFEITRPFQGIRTPYPSSEAQEEIWAELIKQGFKVKHYEDPDPGHPCSSPYTSISW